jgi:hypothetical protein
VHLLHEFFVGKLGKNNFVVGHEGISRSGRESGRRAARLRAEPHYLRAI